MKKIIFTLALVIVLGGLIALGFYARRFSNERPVVVVMEPEAQSIIASPVVIRGSAPGTWFFEGILPIKILNDNGEVIGESGAVAEGEWMTEGKVLFFATITFNAGKSTYGKIVVAKDNPSGLPENDDTFELPVRFTLADVVSSQLSVKLFFIPIERGGDCEKVYEVERTIPYTEGVGRAALEQLLNGPTVVDSAADIMTLIPAGISVNSLKIQEGVAYADFNSVLRDAVAGNCYVRGVRAQIESTLKQFPTIKSVVISVDGKTDGVLQP